MSYTREAIADKTISVAQNQLNDADLKSTIHISATPTNNNGVLLSEWYDSSNPADGTLDALRTNVLDTAGDDHYSTEGKLYEVFAIKLWITRDANAQGTQHEWETAIAAATGKQVTYTFAFDSTASTNLASTDVAYFTDDANTITYAKETTDKKTISCVISSLPTSESTVHGYFFVRIKGDAKDHIKDTSYAAAFDATGEVGNV